MQPSRELRELSDLTPADWLAQFERYAPDAFYVPRGFFALVMRDLLTCGHGDYERVMPLQIAPPEKPSHDVTVILAWWRARGWLPCDWGYQREASKPQGW